MVVDRGLPMVVNEGILEYLKCLRVVDCMLGTHVIGWDFR